MQADLVARILRSVSCKAAPMTDFYGDFTLLRYMAGKGDEINLVLKNLYPILLGVRGCGGVS